MCFSLGCRAWAVKLEELGRHSQGCSHSKTTHAYASVLQVGRQPGYWRDASIRRALAADSGSVGTTDAGAAGAAGEEDAPPAEQNGH